MLFFCEVTSHNFKLHQINRMFRKLTVMKSCTMQPKAFFKYVSSAIHDFPLTIFFTHFLVLTISEHFWLKPFIKLH